MKPIATGDRGAAVEDVQQRLGQLGYELGPEGIDSLFGPHTAAAVRAFRKTCDLPEGDTVDDACWSALVDATFELGDRSLFLKYPFFHGSDVACLQEALNVLGFICGDVDGIFGAHTERALREFQANVGIDPDGIAGSLSFDAIFRLEAVWKGKDATPHSASKLGFSRAAEVLESVEICVFGVDTVTCGIASRIANLALATTPDSQVTSADSIEGAPPQTMLLVQIALAGSRRVSGIPRVAFTDDTTLPTRLMTAAHSSLSAPRRIIVDVDTDRFADLDHPTQREEQHIAVTLLDALCVAGDEGAF